MARMRARVGNRGGITLRELRMLVELNQDIPGSSKIQSYRRAWLRRAKPTRIEMLGVETKDPNSGSATVGG